jgi:hypothetical protein
VWIATVTAHAVRFACSRPFERSLIYRRARARPQPWTERDEAGIAIRCSMHAQSASSLEMQLPVEPKEGLRCREKARQPPTPHTRFQEIAQ